MGREVRHTCYRCGGACLGPGARIAPGERAAIMHGATALGVVDPIDGDRLRTQGGRCVFLQEDNLCALELVAGRDAKPASCRTWPVVPVGDGFVIDPGCLTATLSRDAGPVVGASPTASGPLDAALDGSVPLALARLAGDAGTVSRLPLSEQRWFDRHLDALVDAALDPRNPPGLRARLRHLAGVRGQSAHWPSAPEIDTHALDAARALVAIAPGPPERVARAALRGAVVCAMAGTDPRRFAPALAAWTRLQRQAPLADLLDLPVDEPRC